MTDNRFLIESDFPIEGLNDLSRREAGPNSKKIYQVHRWWARRSGSVFRTILILSVLKELPNSIPTNLDTLIGENNNEGKTHFIKEFWGDKSQPGLFYKTINKALRDKIILDPFMGGGTTIIESLRLGLKIIGNDINPVSWFITKTQILIALSNNNELDKTFNYISTNVKEEIKKYYKTRCPICLEEGVSKEKSLVDGLYYIWQRIVPCKCGKKIPLYYSFITSSYTAANRQNVYLCPYCNSPFYSIPNKNNEITCPSCDKTFFHRLRNILNKKFQCSHCKAENKFSDAVLREKERKLRLVAIEYYCEYHGRGFKKPDKYDFTLYQELESTWKSEFEKISDFIPDQKIPSVGLKTKELLNNGYINFKDLFNTRQIYCLTKLLSTILQVKSERYREIALIVFSAILQTNNLLNTYHPTRPYVGGSFSRHAYQVPPTMLAENNIWGTDTEDSKTESKGYSYAFSNIKKARNSVIHAKENIPFKKGKIIVKNFPDNIDPTYNIDDFFNSSSNCLLLCQNSEDLTNISDKSVDYIITDPPYYDNVIYSELSDFYYSWLYKAFSYLKEYNHIKSTIFFNTPLTLKASEIVVNKAQKKTSDFFISSLGNVFSECNRSLKDEGLFICTYHHSKPESYAAVLQAICEAGFYVVKHYPIHSEFRGSTTSITRTDRRALMRFFDLIIICRKKFSSSERMDWEVIKRELYWKAEESVKRIEQIHKNLSLGDKITVVLGELLEVFTSVYPNVYRSLTTKERLDMKKEGIISAEKKALVSFTEAVDFAFQLAEDFTQTPLPVDTDWLTELYVTTLTQVGSITYDDVLKLTQPRGLNPKLLVDYGLIDEEDYSIYNPISRGREFSSESRRINLYIDVIHYLYSIIIDDQPLNWSLVPDRFKELRKLQAITRFLENLTKDKTYLKIQEMFLQSIPPKSEIEVSKKKISKIKKTSIPIDKFFERG